MAWLEITNFYCKFHLLQFSFFILLLRATKKSGTLLINLRGRILIHINPILDK